MKSAKDNKENQPKYFVIGYVIIMTLCESFSICSTFQKISSIHLETYSRYLQAHFIYCCQVFIFTFLGASCLCHCTGKMLRLSYHQGR